MLTTLVLFASLILILLGAFVMLGVAASGTVMGLAPQMWLALGLLLTGAALGAWGLRSAGHRLSVTRYRPAPWGVPENIVCASGVLSVAVGLWLTSPSGFPDAMNPPPFPVAWPTLPLAATLIPLLLLTPAVLTPRPRPAGASA